MRIFSEIRGTIAILAVMLIARILSKNVKMVGGCRLWLVGTEGNIEEFKDQIEAGIRAITLLSRDVERDEIFLNLRNVFFIFNRDSLSFHSRSLKAVCLSLNHRDYRPDDGLLDYAVSQIAFIGFLHNLVRKDKWTDAVSHIKNNKLIALAERNGLIAAE